MPPADEERTSSVDSAYDIASLLALSAAVVITLTTFRSYGVAWDETWHMEYGDLILEFYRSGFTDLRALSYRNDYLFGGGYDLLGALVRSISADDRYETMHLLGAAIGLLGTVGVHRLGRLLGGPVAAFWSLVLILLLPSYYGHMFNNPKDPPFAAGAIWTLYYLCRLIHELPNPPTSLWWKLGTALGLSVCVRIAGLLHFGYLFAIVGLYGLGCWWRNRRLNTLIASTTRPLVTAIITSAYAWAVMLVSWPWAAHAPFTRPFEAMRTMSHFTLFKGRTLFDGVRLASTNVPPDYVPTYYALQLPEWQEGLLFAALVLALLALPHSRERIDKRLRGSLALLAFATVFPLGYAVVVRSVIYDGLRHFLFLAPILCVFSGLAMAKLLSLARAQSRVAAVAVLCLGLGSAAFQVQRMFELHPHQYVFFNAWAGGLKGAASLYETDFYGNSFKESFSSLAHTLWHADRDAFLNHHYVVAGCRIDDFFALPQLPPNFSFVRAAGRHRGDFFAGYIRANCLQPHARAPEIAVVERQGVVLNVVRDLRKQKP